MITLEWQHWQSIFATVSKDVLPLLAKHLCQRWQNHFGGSTVNTFSKTAVLGSFRSVALTVY